MPKIENATITSVRLGYTGRGVLTLTVHLKGKDWGCGYGGYALDRYIKSKDTRVPTQVGFEAVTRLMKTLDVTDLYDLRKQEVRVEWEGEDIGAAKIAKIGHLTKNRWFSFKDFFESKRK